MNNFQIFGIVLSLIATGFMYYGSYIQSKKNEIFQTNVETYVEEQKESNIPNLVGLKIIGNSTNYQLLVKNIGEKTAEKVKLIFRKTSTPNVFSSNLISGAAEIQKGVEYTLPLNLFSGIEMLLKLSNSDEEYIKDLKESLVQFESGQMVFIPRFFLEYYHNGKKYESDTYYLVIDKIRGVTYLGKE